MRESKFWRRDADDSLQHLLVVLRPFRRRYLTVAGLAMASALTRTVAYPLLLPALLSSVTGGWTLLGTAFAANFMAVQATDYAAKRFSDNLAEDVDSTLTKKLTHLDKWSDVDDETVHALYVDRPRVKENAGLSWHLLFLQGTQVLGAVITPLAMVLGGAPPLLAVWQIIPVALGGATSAVVFRLSLPWMEEERKQRTSLATAERDAMTPESETLKVVQVAGAGELGGASGVAEALHLVNTPVKEAADAVAKVAKHKNRLRKAASYIGTAFTVASALGAVVMLKYGVIAMDPSKLVPTVATLTTLAFNVVPAQQLLL